MIDQQGLLWVGRSTTGHQAMPSSQAKEVHPSHAFRPFLAELTNFISEYTIVPPSSQRAAQLLDGAASHAVRMQLSKEQRATHGIFFSGHLLADKAAALLTERIRDGASVYDPTCGAGDLLVAAARLMPLEASAVATVKKWSSRLGGSDLHSSFIEATRLRLFLLALERHRERGDSKENLQWNNNCFPLIVQADYLKTQHGADFDCLLANPPFGECIASSECTWSSGKTQVAAFFVEHMLRRGRPGQKVVAVLPDVLRSGFRYGKWRSTVQLLSEDLRVLPFGRFDVHTDVDVFLLDSHVRDAEGTRPVEPRTWNSKNHSGSAINTVSKKFNVSVGAVVPHRHKGDQGPWCPYIDVRHATRFGEIMPTSSRRFGGRTVAPPFVVVRRTSNPADTHRVVPTVVIGLRPIAVENHLLVLKPLSGSLESCRALSKYLRSEKVRLLIDAQIRCRHLTVLALQSLPLEEGVG